MPLLDISLSITCPKMLLEQLGMGAEAAPHLEFAASHLTDRPDVLFNLATVYRSLGRPDDAVKVLEKLPNCLVAHRELGELWLSYGRGQEAVFFLTRVETLDPYLVREIVKPGIPVTDAAVTAILEDEYGAEPWFSPVFEPGSGEIESGLFAVQASIGAGILGFALGQLRGRAAMKRELAPLE